jgi:lysophospholipase L1-like esterase
VDVTTVSRQAGNQAAMLVSDGLHPSPKMYTAWSERILPVAKAALSQH